MPDGTIMNGPTHGTGQTCIEWSNGGRYNRGGGLKTIPSFFNNPTTVNRNNRDLGDITTYSSGTYTDVYFEASCAPPNCPDGLFIAGFQMNINGECCVDSTTNIEVGTILNSYGFQIDYRLKPDGSIKGPVLLTNRLILDS